MLQTYRGACIAGKPAPTTAHKPCANAPNMPMWEPACRCCFRQTRVPASLASQLPQVHTSPAPMPPICPCGSRLAGAASDKPGRLHRWQASSHKCTQALGQCTNMPMWQPACRRCFRHTGATASLASQLPQLHTSPWPMHQYAPVAAGLPAMLQTNPGACIAGKPAPTTAHKPCANAPNMPMWEPACRRCFRHTGATASLASQLPQLHTSPWPMHQYAHVGAGLPVLLQTYRGDCIAGKPAPTTAHKPCANAPNMPMWQPACRRCLRQTRATASLASQLPQVHTSHGPIRPVGAGLPAMAAQAACYPCQPPPSAAYTSTNDNDTWAVLSTSAAWLASNAFCTVNTFRKSTVPWAYC